jgi:hypothetical protein
VLQQYRGALGPLPPAGRDDAPDSHVRLLEAEADDHGHRSVHPASTAWPGEVVPDRPAVDADARSTFERGGDVGVSKQLGHSSVAFTAWIYAHVTERLRLAAAGKLRMGMDLRRRI